MTCPQSPTLHQNLIFADIKCYYFISRCLPLSKLPEWYLLSLAARTGWRPVIFMQKSDKEYLSNKLTLGMLCYEGNHIIHEIPKKSFVSLFPLHHDISNNFLEKFSDTKDVYASCVCVCIQFHLKVTYIYTHIQIHIHNQTMQTLSGC
jgi:hypothetical protein